MGSDLENNSDVGWYINLFSWFTHALQIVSGRLLGLNGDKSKKQ